MKSIQTEIKTEHKTDSWKGQFHGKTRLLYAYSKISYLKKCYVKKYISIDTFALVYATYHANANSEKLAELYLRSVADEEDVLSVLVRRVGRVGEVLNSF